MKYFYILVYQHYHFATFKIRIVINLKNDKFFTRSSISNPTSNYFFWRFLLKCSRNSFCRNRKKHNFWISLAILSEQLYCYQDLFWFLFSFMNYQITYELEVKFQWVRQKSLIVELFINIFFEISFAVKCLRVIYEGRIKVSTQGNLLIFSSTIARVRSIRKNKQTWF